MYRLKDLVRESCNTQVEIDGKWVPARPEIYHNWWCLLKDAWEVLRGRADAVWWPPYKESVRSYSEVLVPLLKKAAVAAGVEPERVSCAGPYESIRVGKKIMLKCKVVEDYKGSCHAEVELPDGKRRSFHLNSFLPHNLEPYTGWEDQCLL